MDDLNVLSITDFNGGISPTKGKGVRGSYSFGYGLNIRDNNTLKCSQALKKDSASVAADLVLVLFKASDGKIYGFGDTGKVYRKVSGSWELAYTDSDGRISGACEFKSTSGSYILYATQTKLKRITLANAAGTWSGNITTVDTFTNGIAGDFHTMRNAIGVVIIEDGDLLAEYDYEDAHNMAALRMPTGTKGKSMLDRNDRVIIGGREFDDGRIITWERTQDSWEAKKPAQGNNVNGMGFLEQGVVAQVGDKGNLRYWNFGEVSPLIRIPETANCYPGGVVEYGTLTHFGMNGGTRNGVYSIGRMNLNDPRALALEYIPSHGKLTGTEIGAMATDGEDLYVAWKDGTTYGIDVIDHTMKAPAVYESLKLNMGKPQTEKMLRGIKLALEEALPDGCSITARYRCSRQEGEEVAAADSEGWILASQGDGQDAFDDVGEKKAIFNVEGQGEDIELRLELTPHLNDTPEVRSLNSYFDFDNNI